MALSETLLVQRLRDCWQPLTVAEVAEFEHELGTRLPADYREFLLLKNGGTLYDPIECRPCDSNYPYDIGLFQFFGLNMPFDKEMWDLRYYHPFYRGRVADYMLAIADAGDDLLLLDMRANRGGVFLWVRDDELLKSPEDNALLVAPTFLEFAARCRKEERDEYPLETREPFRFIEWHEMEGLLMFLRLGGDVEETNEHGYTLLGTACRHRNYDAAEELLRRGANPNALQGREGRPCVRVASGAIDLMKLLLAHGASTFMPGAPNVSLLSLLGSTAHERIIRLLGG